MKHFEAPHLCEMILIRIPLLWLWCCAVKACPIILYLCVFGCVSPAGCAWRRPSRRRSSWTLWVSGSWVTGLAGALAHVPADGVKMYNLFTVWRMQFLYLQKICLSFYPGRSWHFPESPFLYNSHYMFYCLGLDPFEADIIQSISLFICDFWWLTFL